MLLIRDDLMAGDYRCLYIAWLARGWDDDDDEDDESESPPIPAGMKNLTGTLKSFAEFMYLDKATLKKAIENAGDDPKKPTAKEVKDWIATLPEKDKTKILSDLLLEKELPQVIQRDLLSRFLKEQTKASPKPSTQEKKCPSCQRKQRNKP